MISTRHLTAAAVALSVAVSFGATASATAARPTPTIQDAADHERARLRDQGAEHIDAADQNIDALRQMNATVPTQKRVDMAARLSSSRDRLHRDLTQIDSGNVSDWRAVRTVVERDMMSLHTELARASTVTNVPVPSYDAP